MELNEHEQLLEKTLEGMPKQPHSNPAWANLGLSEYFYKHHSHLLSSHTSSSSKEATATAAVSKTAFQEIQDGAAAVAVSVVKVEHVAHVQLKRALKTCRAALRTMDAAASDARKLAAALKAKSQKTEDAELAEVHNKRAQEVDLCSAHLQTFTGDFLTFLAEADLLDDATSDDVLVEQTGTAEAFTKKADLHLDCVKRIKATIKA